MLNQIPWQMDRCARHVRHMRRVLGPDARQVEQAFEPSFGLGLYALRQRQCGGQGDHDFTHGSLRPLFIGIVVALALVSLYFPVRDLYVAKRSSDILAKQVEIRQQYNDELQKASTSCSRRRVSRTRRPRTWAW